jgi:hypothetical protein
MQTHVRDFKRINRFWPEEERNQCLLTNAAVLSAPRGGDLALGRQIVPL